MIWNQIYDPFGNMVISTPLAAIPVVVMLVALGFMHIKAHIAAGMGLGSYIDIDKAKEEMRGAGHALLTKALAQAQAAGCQAEVKLIESAERRLGDMIIGAATEWRADLIVMGTHGRRGFERFLVGSVAEHMVRISSTSLLLVREN
jgi:nucleotide-binding universal stress UspA family protein